MINYIVVTQGWSGKKITECETVAEVWDALGNCSLGALTNVQSPTGKDTTDFILF